MRIGTMALTMALGGLLVLCLADGRVSVRNVTGKKVGAPSGVAPRTTPDSEAVLLTPSDERFVTQPGQRIVVIGVGQCKSGETAGRIDLLPPTPGFVQLVPVCRASEFLIGALVISPTDKDVGLHQVRVHTNGCDGSATEHSFQVKVKKRSP